jgi:hypothetical protein
MPTTEGATPTPDKAQGAGTAREFAAFAQQERQRRHNTTGDVDVELFDAAVDYILHKLTRHTQEAGA